MSSILQRLDKYAEQAREPLPGYAAWLEEQDRGFWLGQLRKAALQHYATLPTCPGCGSCETCALSEALAYTADPANGTAGLEAGEIAAALLAAQPRPRVVVVVPADCEPGAYLPGVGVIEVSADLAPSEVVWRLTGGA